MRRLATAALLLIGYVGLGGAFAAPAEAAQCSGTSGVSVVVDFDHGAGGGTSTACDGSGGGRYASAIFPEAGFALTYVSGSGGFVCRVAGRPADADCSRTAPADAYWGLFWAKAGATSWSYASSGVGSLRIPDGGAVAFAFQDGGDTDYPSAAPSQRTAPKPSPRPSPTPAPTATRSSAPTKAPTRAATQAPRTPAASSRALSGAAPGASTGPSAKASASPGATTTGSATASPSAGATADDSASDSTGDSASDSAGAEAQGVSSSAVAPTDEDGGLPWWIPAGVVVLLAGAGAGTAWWRTRGQGG